MKSEYLRVEKSSTFFKRTEVAHSPSPFVGRVAKTLPVVVLKRGKWAVTTLRFSIEPTACQWFFRSQIASNHETLPPTTQVGSIDLWMNPECHGPLTWA
jgi:hypothetical protein